jgi:hypothetical protein
MALRFDIGEVKVIEYTRDVGAPVDVTLTVPVVDNAFNAFCTSAAVDVDEVKLLVHSSPSKLKMKCEAEDKDTSCTSLTVSFLSVSTCKNGNVPAENIEDPAKPATPAARDEAGQVTT